MGTTLKNCYCFPAKQKEALEAALVKCLEEEGLELSQTHDSCELIAEVVPAEDESAFLLLESTRASESRAFQQRLAELLACDVIYASVYDGNLITLEYHKHDTGEVISLAVGHHPQGSYLQSEDISCLYPFLGEGVAPEDLALVWQGHYRFAEEKLFDLFALLGYGNALQQMGQCGVLCFTKAGE